MPTWSTTTGSASNGFIGGAVTNGSGSGKRWLRPARLLLGGFATLLITLAGLLLITFALSRLSPIDPALRLVGDHASSSSYVQARQKLGLDAPWPLQFERYIVRLAHGDLGLSLSTGEPVRDDLRRVFPATLELATLAMAISVLAGLSLGVLAAWRPRGFIDALVRVISLVGNSIPIFWLGLLSLFLFYAHLHWVGGPGRLDDAFEYTIDMQTGLVLVDTWRSHVPGAFGSAIAHLVLPVLILASYAIGNVTRQTRAALINESGKEYATLARAKGATEIRVLLRHVLPNASGIILTVLALTYANLLEGAVLIETVFAWPGLGRYLTTALFAADTPAILGGTLLIGVCFVIINGLTDILVRLLDPRIR
jgi:peptide/nickel transport system permease protein